MLQKVFDLDLRVADNLPQEPPPDVLAGVYWDDRSPSVRVPQEDMAPTLPHDFEPEGLEGSQRLTGRQRRQARQASDLNSLDPDELYPLRNGLPRAEVCTNRLADALPELV